MMNSTEIMPCEYTKKTTLEKKQAVINCKNCKNGFEIENCLPKIVLAISNFYNLDSLILSDYKEREFSEKQVEILELLNQIIKDLENYSSRTVSKEGCDGCQLNPSLLYPELKKKIISDPASIYDEIADLLEDTKEGKACEECRNDLNKELKKIANKSLELRSKTLSEGFGIIR